MQAMPSQTSKLVINLVQPYNLKSGMVSPSFCYRIISNTKYYNSIMVFYCYLFSFFFFGISVDYLFMYYLL